MRVAAVCRETHSRNKHSNGLNSWAPIYLSWERARMSRQHSVNVDALNERHTKQTMSQIPAQCTAANASRTPSMISFGSFVRLILIIQVRLVWRVVVREHTGNIDSISTYIYFQLSRRLSTINDFLWFFTSGSHWLLNLVLASPQIMVIKFNDCDNFN